MNIPQTKIIIGQEDRKVLQASGFTLQENEDPELDELMTSLYFTCSLQPEDKKNILSFLEPHHFEPLPYRNLFIGRCHWSDGGYGFYATSHVRGKLRLYRGRRTIDDYDAANIFASGKTLQECVRKFVDAYRNLKYNRD